MAPSLLLDDAGQGVVGAVHELGTQLHVAAARGRTVGAAADAAALLPVNGKRTTPTPKGAADPNDFDGAFAEAAAAA